MKINSTFPRWPSPQNTQPQSNHENSMRQIPYPQLRGIRLITWAECLKIAKVIQNKESLGH